MPIEQILEILSGSRVDRQTGKEHKSELVGFYIRRAGSKKQEIGNGDAMPGRGRQVAVELAHSSSNKEIAI